MINLPKIFEITREYYENDVSLQILINFLRSEKFSIAAKIFMESDEVDDITEWMKNHGVDFKEEILEFDEKLSGGYLAASLQSVFSEFSYKSYEDEIRNEIDYNGVNELIDKFLSDGNDFAHLYLILNVSRSALENIFNHDEIQDVLKSLMEMGVNIEYLNSVIYDILRWK